MHCACAWTDIRTLHTVRTTTTPSPHPLPFHQLELFQLFEEEPGGRRPGLFTEPRPQEQVQRHTVEQLADFTPMVQILDDQLVDVLMLFDATIPEQVIAVPKISCPSRPPRAALAATQMAEQLVEVPTDVVLVVDIPVPGARGSFDMEVFKVSFQFPVEVFKISPRSGFSSFFRSSAQRAVSMCFFRNFPQRKKCGGFPGGECESARALELIHASG